jgi:hypothetical protein
MSALGHRRLCSFVKRDAPLSVRRLPPPWTVERIEGGFKVIDANANRLPMSIHARSSAKREAWPFD